MLNNLWKLTLGTITAICFTALTGCEVSSSLDATGSGASTNDTAAATANTATNGTATTEATGDTSTNDTAASASTANSSESSAEASAASPSGGNANPNDGSGGFLWKPESEGDGNLVVLLPTSFRGQVTGAAIVDSSDSVIENGRFAGDEHNGMRPHYRFSMPGSGYGQNIKLVASTRNGSRTVWPIANGGSRVD